MSLMNLRICLLIAWLMTSACSEAATSFQSVQLSADAAQLTVTRSDGTRFDAPRLGDQDSFASPAMAADHQAVGWLALYPGVGASYSMPLELVVLDTAGHLQRFAGDFGMVFGWCFDPRSRAVVYRVQLPHGSSPIQFEMRDFRSRRLLKRFRLEAVGPDESETEVLRRKAPRWTACAHPAS